MPANPKTLASLSRASDGDATAHHVASPPSRWKTRVLLPVVIGVTLVGLLAWTASDVLRPRTVVNATPVVMKTVQGSGGTASSGVSIQAPGWVEPDPFPTYVASLADGIVDAVHVLEGDAVTKGQVLASLVDDESRIALDRAQAELARKEAQLLEADADLVAAELELKHQIELKRDLAVAQSASAELQASIAKAHADVEVARATLASVQDEYTRKAELLETQAVSEAEVRRLELSVRAQESVVEASMAQVAVLEARQAKAAAILDATQERLTLLIDEERAVQRARAARAMAQADVALSRTTVADAALTLDRMQVRAPMDGVILQRLISPGSKMTFGGDMHAAHVFHLYDPRALQVRVDVPLADAAGITVGQTAEVIVDILPDVVFSGSVSRIVREADIQKNTVEVKVAINDPAPAITPEMLARVKLLASNPNQQSNDSSAGGSSKHALFAPLDHLMESGDGQATAYVVVDRRGDRGTIEKRTLTLGRVRMDGWVEITDGLRAGDLVITAPSETMHAGDRVRVTDAQAQG